MSEDTEYLPTSETCDYPLDRQVGGNHYKKMKIQTTEFCMANDLDHCQSNAIKYVCRHEDKDGEIDLDKAIHYIEILKEFKYGKG